MPKKCRLCHSGLSSKPVIELYPVPKSAQFLPSKEEFNLDIPNRLKIYQCLSCGLIQTSGTPVSYHKDVITASSLSPKVREFRLQRLREICKAFSLEGKSVLEIGCASGTMLDVLKDTGLIPTGIEHLKQSVIEGQQLGRNIIHGYILDGDFEIKEKYNSFVIFYFLEHIPNLDLFIKKVYNITSCDAVGYVTVPNIDNLIESKCNYEFVADHVSYFTKNTLRFAFEKNGFEVIGCSDIENNDGIEIILKKRQPVDFSKTFDDVAVLIRSLQELIKKHNDSGKKVAVWGAGHRTLTLLSLAKLDNIHYIVDSASFKQGKFSPILHIPIVSPQNLLNDPVDLILIMVPGLYSVEILSKIKEMGLVSEIAILQDNHLIFK
jgi:2-polyprenyl-3-methyl-5-hydroxy-6-metoxy-1,4-benzoquinol methylase